MAEGKLDLIIAPTDGALLDAFEPVHDAVIVEHVITYQFARHLTGREVHQTDHTSRSLGPYTLASSEALENRRRGSGYTCPGLGSTL